MLAILFLIAGSLLAQPVFPLLITPRKASGGGGGGGTDIPLTVPGIAFRLKSSDLLVGQNVSNWTDQIHGLVYTNVNSSTWCTNSAKGVWFNVGSFLQSSGSGWSFDSTQQILIIFNEHSASANGAIVGSTTAGKFIGYMGAAQFGSVFFGFDTGEWCGPIAFDTSCDAMTTGAFLAYTNGIEGFSSWIEAFSLNLLGVDTSPTHVDKYSGYLAEVDIWTNATAFNSTTRSNLHYYATNTSALAPFSP